MSSPKPYRAPGARLGFAPSRPPQRPPRVPHPAWRVVQVRLEQRQRRCRFIIDANGEHPDHPDRLAALAEHGAESYQAELADIKRKLRVVERAIAEAWTEVPAGVNAALDDVRRAESRLERGIGPRDAGLKALWRAHDLLQRRLFRPAMRKAA